MGSNQFAALVRFDNSSIALFYSTTINYLYRRYSYLDYTIKTSIIFRAQIMSQMKNYSNRATRRKKKTNLLFISMTSESSNVISSRKRIKHTLPPVIFRQGSDQALKKISCLPPNNFGKNSSNITQIALTILYFPMVSDPRRPTEVD